MIGAVFAAAVCTVSAQAPAAPPASEKKPTWDTSAALGFTLTKGNSDTVTFNANINTVKKWEQNEVKLGADATYGENDGEKNADTLHGFGQYNRLFTDRAYGYARLDALRDDIAGIDYRFTFGPGIGYYFIKKEDRQLSGEFGPAFIYEKEEGSSATGYFTLRLAERFDQKLNDHVKIWQSLEILPQVDDFENFIVNAEVGVEAALSAKLSLRAFVQDSYDNQPANDRKKNDLRLVTALAYKF